MKGGSSMYCVVGIENVNYISKKTNREVVGTKLHLLCEDDEEDENLIGQKVEDVYISEDILVNGINVGDKIDISYNKFGRVTKVNVC